MPQWISTRRGKTVAAVVVVAAVLVVAFTSWRLTRPQTVALCADMNDSIGLYHDAPVTIMGIKIGSVQSFHPSGDHVRVDMNIKKRELAAGVRAVVMNNSILTDRRVELVDWQPTPGPQFSFASCIPLSRTATPINVNDSLQAFDNMSKQLAAASSDGKMPLNDLINRLAGELNSTGPTLNDTIKQVGQLMNSPDEFISQLRQLLDNAQQLTTLTAQEWPNVKTMSPTLTTVFGVGGDLLGLFPGLLQNLATTSAGPLQRLFTQHLPYLNPLLDQSVPVIDQVANHVASGKEILDKVPAIVELMKNMFDRQQSALKVTYSPPEFAVSAVSAALVCEQLNKTRADACNATSNSRATVPLIQMVLSAIGGTS